jgi:poly(A) polymerase
VQQKIYLKEDHHLDLEQIDSDALYVLEKLVSAGYTAYLVGGGVRDLLLGKQPKDYDISTSAEPEQIRKLFRNCILIGRRFRLAHIRFGKKIIEASTFRTGDTENDALIIRDNEWGSPEEDVLRRDFTINGLFYDAKEQQIIDYVGGFEDLQKRHLKTIGQAFIRFKQDPVRMLRLLKFRARFDFSIDEEAHIALIETKQEIHKSAPARILEEILRMLESGSAYRFFQLLMEYGLLELILPGLTAGLMSEQKDEVFSFLQEIDKQTVEGKPVDRAISLACLLFPLIEKRINILFSDLENPPHLGQIEQETTTAFEETFESFLKIPKRLAITVIEIITTQFRLTPFERKKNKTIKVPHLPGLGLSLAFLHLRACIDPSLQKINTQWQTAFANLPEAEPSSYHEETPLPQKRRRRRRR